ncbi:hypothetical protein GCM10009119_15950 [Algoriphagus jejuensis]|uniref:Uncharacterized protein n=1 Tax=Algoriphagus jejuensis TaxID=419934 RepID=A0ABP3YFU8_9BACT
MELDEMKSLWQNLSVKVENQDRIQKDILLEMTKTKFRRKMNGIRIPELFGSLFCFGYAGYLIFQFDKIDLRLLQVLGILDIVFLVLIPVASLITVYRLRSLQINHLSTAEMLEAFGRAKRNFWRVQQVGVWLAGMMVLTLVPILGDIQDRLDELMEVEFWMIFLPFVLAFMFFFSRYVLRRYRKVMDQSEDLLKDI